MRLSAVLTFADVSVDLFTRKGHRAGRPYLAQRPHEPVHRYDLYADVIGRMEVLDSNTLEVQVSRLRETLGEPLRAPVLVVTVPFGYMLAVDATVTCAMSSVSGH